MRKIFIKRMKWNGIKIKYFDFWMQSCVFLTSRSLMMSQTPTEYAVAIWSWSSKAGVSKRSDSKERVKKSKHSYDFKTCFYFETFIFNFTSKVFFFYSSTIKPQIILLYRRIESARIRLALVLDSRRCAKFRMLNSYCIVGYVFFSVSFELGIVGSLFIHSIACRVNTSM